jgi:hypothetical protein
MEGKTKRQGIFDGLCAELDQNLKNRRGHLHSLRESLGSETKSSAGDKHETGRAMIHSEQARVQDSVNRLEAMLSKLRQYAAVIGPIQRVSPGALVETTGPWVLVGVPMGKVQLPDALVLCVGAEAPLAQQWHGAQPGDQVVLGSQQLTIQAIY